MIKEFQNLKKQLVQSLKETHQHKQLVQKTITQFESEKIDLFKKLIKALTVLNKQIALAKKLPNIDDRTNKLLLEIYESHHNSIEEILTNSGVTILSDNASDTFSSAESPALKNSSNNIVLKRYFYQKKPLINDD